MINLDAMSEDELQEAVRHLSTLANYAMTKRNAMYCRRMGDIPSALNIEAMCEKLYNTLPQEYRW